ncbi:hypothetical protein D3C72_2343330 [compost metagenome]
MRTCAKHQVAGGDIQRAAGTAGRRAIARYPEVAGGGAVVEQGFQLPLANQQQIRSGCPLAIERLDVHAAGHIGPALQSEPA